VIKFLFALFVLACVSYGAYAGYHLGRRYLLSRSRKGRAVLDKEDAEHRRSKALRMSGRLEPDDPDQGRLDVLVKLADLDIAEADRVIRGDEIESLERKELED
jgi:hypothetical protein